jgi:hypothetical protein
MEGSSVCSRLVPAEASRQLGERYNRTAAPD